MAGDPDKPQTRVPGDPADQPSLRSRVVRGLSWSFLQTWASHAITFVVFLVIARLLGPEAFGTVVIAYVVLGAFTALVDLGLCDAVIRLRDATQAHYDTVFAVINGFALACLVLLIATAGLLARWLDQPPLQAVMVIVAAALPVTALGLVQAAVMRRHMMFKALAMRTLASGVAGGIVGVGLALAGFGYWSLVVKGLVEAAVATALVWRHSPFRPTLSFDRIAWRELYVPARHLLASRVIDIAAQRVDSLIVSRVLGAAALGLYTAGQRIYRSMMEALYMAIQRVALPAFVQIAHDPARTRTALLRMVTITSFFTFPLFAITGVLADPLIPVLFGEKWHGAAAVLNWYCVAGVLFSVSYFNAPLLVAAGRTGDVLSLTVINTVLNVAGFMIGVYWGIVGVAAAFAIRGYLALPVSLYYMRKSIGLSPLQYARALLPNFGATLGTVLVVVGAQSLLPQTVPASGRLAAMLALALTAQLAFAATLSRRTTIDVLTDLRQMADSRPAAARALTRCLRFLKKDT